MTWDESKEDKACPCGTGTYTITRRANDWGQGGEWFEMNCSRCRETYVQFKLDYLDPGAPGSTSILDLWVLRRDKEAVDDLQKQIKRTEQSMLAKALPRYLSRWLKHFAGKSKKDVWRELKPLDRSHVPSLGTFYKHTKDGVETYLQDFFAAKRIISILDLLKITDSEMTELNQRLRNMDREYEAVKKKMIDAGVYA
jgi:hypothetical protein